MGVEYTKRKQKDVLIINVKGRMVLGKDPIGLMKYVIQETKTHKKFVIDLGKVELMDSAGVGEIVAANVAVKEKGGKLHLANLDESVGKILQMALVHKIVPTFETQKEAIAAFGE